MDLSFPGYTIKKLSSNMGDFSIYEARRNEDQKSVFIKAPISQYPSPAITHQLELAYDVAMELDPELVLRPLGLERRAGNIALVLENGTCQPLSDLLGTPMETGQFLNIAIGASEALAEIHKHNIVHKDIKPANLFIDAGAHASSHVRISGFEMASRLPREHQILEPPELIAGTLAYMAPEQTGRMNRSIDSRSDLYSLGITFYEMLTGFLPFTASDPMEWVHCHIARAVMPPAERLKEIPQPLSAIVMKLLAKSAEERYQTDSGLKADLQHCLKEWESHERIGEFPLGTYDVPDHLLVPEKLYGRESEIKTLLAAFDRVVANGRLEFVLVSGYSGIGKSSVINELHKVLVPSRGQFASGKFDQYKRDIPYSTLVQALQTLVNQILTKSEDEIAVWRNVLLKSLNPNGQLIISLLPDISLIIGEQPPVPELPLQEAQNRFRMVLQRLLTVFAQREHPLVLFLDDLQWLDAATLELLNHLASEKEVQYLLLIGAYRDNEVNATHPLMRTLDLIRKAQISGDGAMLQEITLSPLTLDDVELLVADSLHSKRERALPLAQLVHEKTGGNPFFIIQFLTTLTEEGLLTFNRDAGRWTWDLTQIRAKGYTDNVVHLLVKKLMRLSENTQTTLKHFACLGNAAEVSNLTWIQAQIQGVSEETTQATLIEAEGAGLIFRQENTYKFLHDRVQEAAYSLISEIERPAIHLRIGRLLLAQIKPGLKSGLTIPTEIEEKIFEIVGQFNRSTKLIAALEERERVAELNLIAGKRAKRAAAYLSALRYFETGTLMLSEDRWQRRYELAFALELQQAECEHLTGDLASAEERLLKLSNRAQTLADKAAVTCLLLNLYTATGKSDQGVEVCLKYLRRVGIQWAQHPTDEDMRQEFEQLWRRLGSRSIEELITLPMMSDPDWRVTLDVLMSAQTAALTIDENLFALIIGRLANISIEHGNCDASSMGYVGLGMVLGPRFGNYQAGFRFCQLGFDLVEKRGLSRFKAHVYFAFAALNWRLSPLRARVALYWLAFDAANERGDLTIACYTWTNVIGNHLAAGDPLDEVQRQTERGLEFVKKAKFGLIVYTITGQLRLIQSLRGLTPAQFDERGFEQYLEVDPRLASSYSIYWINKLQIRFFAGDYTAAIEAASKAKRFLRTMPSFIEVEEYHFYGALSLAARADTASASERREHLKALIAHHHQLALWAENGPENFGARASVVAAEIARLEGQEFNATLLYEEAVRSASENGFIHIEAISNELAAKYYAKRGSKIISRTFLQEARYCYVRWGANEKVKQLDEQNPWTLERKSQESATLTAHPAILAIPQNQLDLMTIIKAQNAISSETSIGPLAEILLRIVLENAGARKGYLFVEPDAELLAVVRPEENSIEFKRGPFEITFPPISVSILSYVKRTRKNVILDDATTDAGEFSSDPYLLHAQPKSVLCMPIVRQANLIGVLYLENNLTAGAFTPARRTVLEMIAAQAAISLEIAISIHQRNQAEKERDRLLVQEQQARAEAEKALKLRDEFILLAAHELRTPLTPLKLQLRLLRKHVTPKTLAIASETQKKNLLNLLETSDEQMNSLSKLVENLLDISRMSSERLTLDLETIDLSELVYVVINRFQSELTRAHCTIELHAESKINGQWDRLRIEQVVVNLLTNAIKYGAGKPIKIKVTQEGNFARLAVRDYGIGIEEKDQKRIFDRFERATSIYHFGGFGLGLYISRQFIQAHHGSIHVESQPGAGSTFTVSLPLNPLIIAEDNPG